MSSGRGRRRSNSVASNVSRTSNVSNFSGLSNFSAFSRISQAPGGSFPNSHFKKLEIRKPASNQKDVISISSVDYNVIFEFKGRRDINKYTIIQLLIMALFTAVSSRLHGFNLSKSRSKFRPQNGKTYEKPTIPDLLKKNLQNIRNRIPNFIPKQCIDMFLQLFEHISKIFKTLDKQDSEQGKGPNNNKKVSDPKDGQQQTKKSVNFKDHDDNDFAE